MNHGKQWQHAAWLALVLAGMARAGPPATVIEPPASSFDTFAQLAEFLDTVQRHYAALDRLKPSAPTTALLRAFLHALDPEASLLTPAEVAALSHPGVGLALTVRDGYPTILSPRDGTPAQRAGLLPGEKITGLNGQPVLGLSPCEVMARLCDPTATNLTLNIFDPVARQHRTIALTPAPPTPLPARIIFIADGIGYYRLAEITPAAVEQLSRILMTPALAPTKGLILDLRNNPGGALDATVALAGLFLPEQTTVVTLTFPTATQRASLTTRNPRPLSVPLVLLVNNGTAAAAEVLAAALRDHQRAWLVGIATAGVGRFFSRFGLATGNVADLPAAYFDPPGNQRFDQTGLTPHQAVPLPRETERAFATTGYGSFNWATDRARILATDRQLTAALERLTRP